MKRLAHCKHTHADQLALQARGCDVLLAPAFRIASMSRCVLSALRRARDGGVVGLGLRTEVAFRARLAEGASRAAVRAFGVRAAEVPEGVGVRQRWRGHDERWGQSRRVYAIQDHSGPGHHIPGTRVIVLLTGRSGWCVCVSCLCALCASARRQARGPLGVSDGTSGCCGHVGAATPEVGRQPGQQGTMTVRSNRPGA